jgi:hypothetical protein
MSRPRSIRTALAAVVVLTIVACSDAVAPRALNGIYTLASIDGSGPPLIVMDCLYSDGSRYEEVITYDSLTFTSDSTVHRHWQLDGHSYYADGTSGLQSHSLEYSGWFARTGDEVIVSRDPFGPGADTLRFDGRQLSMSRYVEFECDEYSGKRHLASFVYRQ